MTMRCDREKSSLLFAGVFIIILIDIFNIGHFHQWHHVRANWAGLGYTESLSQTVSRATCCGQLHHRIA